MIQAYRRGLLRREMPFGARSRMREEILLESIQSEEVSHAAEKRMEVASALIGPASLAREGRQKIMKDMSSDLRYFELFRLMDFDRAEQLKYDNSSLAITAMYEILRRAGIMND